MRHAVAGIVAVLEVSPKAVEEIRAELVGVGYEDWAREYEGAQVLDLNGFLVRARTASTGHARVERRKTAARRPVRGGRSK